MRPAEALALELRDLTPDGLLIRESKFKKSRLLPLHDTTRALLEHYLRQRRRVAGHNPHLFVSCRGDKLSHTVVAETFHHVVKAAGIPVSQAAPDLTSWISGIPSPCAGWKRALTTVIGSAAICWH